jgi:ribosomal-protein-alanine N-acetyltransferase
LTRSTKNGKNRPALRSAADPDLNRILELEEEIFPDAWPLAAFEEHLDTDEAELLVAEIDGRIVGYACCRFDGDDLHLTNLAVEARFRRKSVAKGLLDHILGLARDRASDLVLLEVRVSNEAARGFYEAAGFDICDTCPGYYDNPDEDAIVMSKWVDATHRDR